MADARTVLRKFGLSSGDLATVSQWLGARGFKITATARSRTFIQFSGTVAQAEAAFQTSIHRVSLNGEEHLANVTAVILPSGIAGVVGSVSGLDDFKLKARARAHRVQGSADPKFTSSISGSHFIAPGDFYTIYDVKPLLTSSINGAGITIAVAGQTDISLSDVAAFRSASGLSANLPTVKLYGTDPGTPLTDGVAEDETEADLDVEWSGAVAPSASIIYVNSTDVINSLVQIIDNKLASIASISYGDCEAGYGSSQLNQLNQAFMQANAEQLDSGDAGEQHVRPPVDDDGDSERRERDERYVGDDHGDRCGCKHGPVSTRGPTGTVQFLVDNVASGAAVTLIGGAAGSEQATATFTLATASLGSGSHTVSAAYSGDTTYAGSKGSVTVDVTSATAADFTLTPATATVTTKSGTDATGLVFTVTPVNGFTGQVTFTSGTTSSTLNASASFSVNPVVISSTGAGTTTFTLSAYIVNGQAVGSTGKVRLRQVRAASAAPAKTVGRAWYAGLGAALTCMVLLLVPRRRKFAGVLGVMLAVAALGGMLGMSGCGSGSSNIATNTNSAPGTYTINVSATGTNAAGVQLTHNSVVTFVVQ